MNQPIAEWLRLLAGSNQNYNKLIDWLACAPSLDKPLCGLILAGPPQTGKSLFAQGLKPLWQKYERATAPAALMVYREEPPFPYVMAERYPYARFVMAVNHPTTLIEDIPTSIDLQDVERRWLYLEHTEEAAEYLAAHKSYLKTWADQEIAAMAEALNQWRKVQRAGHLWVQGTIGAMRHLVSTTTDKERKMTEKIDKTTDEDDVKTKQKQTKKPDDNEDKDEEIIMGESYSGCK